MNTQNLSDFGFREYAMAGELLTALANNKWEKNSELNDGIKLEFNPNSGEVFLVDEDYNVAMMSEGAQEETGKTPYYLENWLNCSYCGAEGFRTELTLDNESNCSDCKGK